MPELPDVVVYIESLERRLLDQPLERIRINSPFVLRSVMPPIAVAEMKRIVGVLRLGKRIVLALEDELFLVLHLMIAGRLRWLLRGAKLPGTLALAAFDFPAGTLLFTEAGSRKRASLHLLQGKASLAGFDLGGLEVYEADLATFAGRLSSENHTWRRALTDPRLFSGIGNAYSDEILHRAQLSPIALTGKLGAAEIARLFEATKSVLAEWTMRLRQETGAGFPERVTAFRREMAVHGRFGKPCPICQAPVQRIVYAENECNYCARCQTGGKVLADRALSRLLHKRWPRSIDELG